MSKINALQLLRTFMDMCKDLVGRNDAFYVPLPLFYLFPSQLERKQVDSHM